MKKKLWKIWRGWLVLSIPANIISMLVMACMLDSESKIPAIVMAVNLVWLAILFIANDDIATPKKRKEKNDDEINVA